MRRGLEQFVGWIGEVQIVQRFRGFPIISDFFCFTQVVSENSAAGGGNPKLRSHRANHPQNRDKPNWVLLKIGTPNTMCASVRSFPLPLSKGGSSHFEKPPSGTPHMNIYIYI